MVINTQYDELAGSPEFTYSRRHGAGTQRFKVPWTEVTDFLELVMPDPYISGSEVVQPPAATFPGQPWMIARSVDVKPWDPESPIGDGVFPAKYSAAVCTINYAATDYDQNSSDQRNDAPGGAQQTYLSIDVDIGGEFSTLPNGALERHDPSDPSYDVSKYPGGPPPELKRLSGETRVGLIVPSREVSLNWHFVPFPPWDTIEQAVGKVNAFVFYGCPPETLLFLGVKARREITQKGVRVWDLTYKFSKKNNNAITNNPPFGFNHYLRQDGLSGGYWGRIQRRILVGYTTLRLACNAGATTLAVVDAKAFPATGNFGALVGGAADQETLVLTRTASGAAFTVVTGGGALHDHPAGEPVYQTFSTALNLACNAKTTNLQILDATGFPTNGQFYIQIDQEKMIVLANPEISGLANWTVVRGISGTTAAAHLLGATVTLINAPVYDLWDFSNLFKSGLVVG